MRNVQITRIEEKNYTIREMSTLELCGAVAIITQLLQNYYEEMGCENQVSMQEVDSDTYYCGRLLYIDNGCMLIDDEGQLVKLTSVFCLEGNHSVLFGYIEVEDEEGEVQDFLVRI